VRIAFRHVKPPAPNSTQDESWIEHLDWPEQWPLPRTGELVEMGPERGGEYTVSQVHWFPWHNEDEEPMVVQVILE
jgi:hypothetical protein